MTRPRDPNGDHLAHRDVADDHDARTNRAVPNMRALRRNERVGLRTDEYGYDSESRYYVERDGAW